MLDIELGQTLGRTHDRCRIDGLVGGDHDEALAADGDGGVDGALGTEKIIVDREARVVLHHGYMLVRGGVEDDVGLFLAKEGQGALGVNNIVQRGAAGDEGKSAGDLAVDLKERVLTALHEDDLSWAKAGDDPADFATDRASCARHQHGAAADDGANRSFVNLTRRAADEALQVDIDLGARTDASKLVLERGHEAISDGELAKASADGGEQIGHGCRQRDQGEPGPSGGADRLELLEVAQDRRPRSRGGIRTDMHTTEDHRGQRQKRELSLEQVAGCGGADEDRGGSHVGADWCAVLKGNHLCGLRGLHGSQRLGLSAFSGPDLQPFPCSEARKCRWEEKPQTG